MLSLLPEAWASVQPHHAFKAPLLVQVHSCVIPAGIPEISPTELSDLQRHGAPPIVCRPQFPSAHQVVKGSLFRGHMVFICGVPPTAKP